MITVEVIRGEVLYISFLLLDRKTRKGIDLSKVEFVPYFVVYNPKVAPHQKLFEVTEFDLSEQEYGKVKAYCDFSDASLTRYCGDFVIEFRESGVRIKETININVGQGYVEQG